MDNADPPKYRLDHQVGFLMRRATQRHLAIFARLIPDLTPTQFAALAKLCELGQVSQNALGRHTAMDAATIKGVVDRLRKKGFVQVTPDPNDQRRVIVAPSPQGVDAFENLRARAFGATRDTLKPLSPSERERFLVLLAKLT